MGNLVPCWPTPKLETFNAQLGIKGSLAPNLGLRLFWLQNGPFVQRVSDRLVNHSR